MNNLKAFTLAEVLITLGIIGVVATITLPVINNSVKNSVIKSQVRKANSILNNALREAEAENRYKFFCYYWEDGQKSKEICAEYSYDGRTCKRWTTPDGEELDIEQNGAYFECPKMWNAISKKLNVVKRCESNSYTKGCIPAYTGADDSPQKTNNQWVAGWQKWQTKNIREKCESWVLSDGTIILLYGSGEAGLFGVDVNGKKGPNKWGYDIFEFRVTSKSHTSPSKIGPARGSAITAEGGISDPTIYLEK